MVDLVGKLCLRWVIGWDVIGPDLRTELSEYMVQPQAGWAQSNVSKQKKSKNQSRGLKLLGWVLGYPSNPKLTEELVLFGPWPPLDKIHLW